MMAGGIPVTLDQAGCRAIEAGILSSPLYEAWDTNPEMVPPPFREGLLKSANPLWTLHKRIQRFAFYTIVFPVKPTVNTNYHRVHSVFEIHEGSQLAIP